MTDPAENSYIAEYYSRRAKEYDKIYEKPERQEDLETVRGILRKQFVEHDVLEIACGTGFWTAVIANVAKGIAAIDVSDEVLEIAKNRLAGSAKVSFHKEDAYRLTYPRGSFSAGFAGFWFSHVPVKKRKMFFEVLHGKLRKGGLFMMIDNRYVEGSNHPITDWDEEGNSYQTRKLDNGREYKVLKNFLREADFRDLLADTARELEFRELTYYWCLSYRIA